MTILYKGTRMVDTSTWDIVDTKHYMDATAEELTRMAQDPRPSMRGVAERHPNTPPLVRLWLKTYRESGIPLEEFLEAAHEKV